ncbi:zf-C3HC-domain-containing protein [Marasmius fiardii PR-910]|nr:zf-C3HC-domain-containing protein [Marasmius fiardii PR-910]
MNVNGHPVDSDSSTGSSMRATKRKLDDAFHRLDAAVTPKDAPTSEPPTKKPSLSRTLYSTLTKYGIKTKEPAFKPYSSTFSKSTPHLTAILSRAATRTRDTFNKTRTASPVPPSGSNTDYRPSSIPSFLNRLSTFKLSTYANKPPQIDAVAASKCGWINDGKDRLVCGICGVSWVVTGREGMTREAANALIEKQRVSLVESHKTGCPWKTRQCDDLIYRIPLQSPATTVRDLKEKATILDPILQSVEIKHPLTPNQLGSLQSVIGSYVSSSVTKEDSPTNEEATSLPTNPPSAISILTALFGWEPAPERPRTISLSRPNSRVPTSSSTPTLTRASSLAPTASSPRPSLLQDATNKANSQSRDTSLLHCALCQRRVGLWAFVSQPPPPLPPTDDSPQQANNDSNSARPSPKQRQFDLLKEHRSYCPYVVRSTTVPTLPTTSLSTSTTSLISRSSQPQGRNGHVRSGSSTSQLSSTMNGPIEGWRAVLTVALRYRMVQRHREQSSRRLREGDVDSMDVDPDMVDGVEAMLEGVKSRGGKDLLKYVKGLLG